MSVNEPPLSAAFAAAWEQSPAARLYSGALPAVKCSPSLVAVSAREAQTLDASPTNARRTPASLPACSRMVSMSLMLWTGWLMSSMPLMTGTSAWRASSTMVSLFLARISMASHMRLSVRAVSPMVSRPGRWISPGRR